MKQLLFSITFIFCSYFVNAQDTLSLRTGEKIKVKVIEISTANVKYLLSDNLNGPNYVVEKSKISEIIYQNGRKETFPIEEYIDVNSIIVKTNTKSEQQAPLNYSNPAVYTYEKGVADASAYYHGQNAGRTGVMLTALLTNGLYGLIPAIPCSLTPPQIHNLGIPNMDVYRSNAAYAEGYNKQAKKIKSRKIWTNWGIGTAISTIFIIVLSKR